MPKKTENKPKSTTCPITASRFAGSAPPLTLSVGQQPMVASPREFSTGSFGWFSTGKTVLTVDGVPLTVQVGITLTVVGSKDAAR